MIAEEQQTEIFGPNLESEARTVVNQGGTSSGKTYTILQVLFVLLCTHERRVATVVGQDIPNLKKGAIRDAAAIFESTPALQNHVATYNRAEHTYKFHNGSLLEFTSYDGPQDAKSGKRDYLFINEANGVNYRIYQELSLRTRIREWLDYNPNSEFWVHEHLLGQPGVEYIISDHRHNPFLSGLQRAKIEELWDKDEQLAWVYARGKTGKIEGLVYTDWTVVDEIPEGAPLIAVWLDFGFTNDPTASGYLYRQQGCLWLDELIYETGLTNPDISLRLKSLDVSGNTPIVADSAEPKSIAELSAMGWTIEGAVKGPDSLSAGIDLLRRYPLRVTARSTNLRRELLSYKWAVDKATGKPLNKPADAFNHHLDGVRYVALNKLNLTQRKQESWAF